MLSEAAWAVREPLTDAVRPHGKTPPKELRRTISAIFWRHRNGAKWRRIPSGLGPWWLAAQLFIRRAKRSVWEHLLELVQQRGIALGMVFIDGTTIRAQHKAAGAQKRGAGGRERDRREALGRSRGGWGTKVCVIADGCGRAIRFAPAPGQAHELPMARNLLGRLPAAPGWVVGDRGLVSDDLRERIWDIGARPCDPAPAHRCPGGVPGLDLQQPPLGREPVGAPEGMARRRHPLQKDQTILPRGPLSCRCRRLAQVIKL
jgi:transposase